MLRFKRKYHIGYHIVTWSALVVSIFLWRSWNHGPREPQLTNTGIVLLLLPYIALFYVHAYWLMPAFLFRQKRGAYILLVLGALLVMVSLSGLIFYFNRLPPPGTTYLQSVGKRVGTGIFILLASASVGAVREAFRLEKNRKEKETEHLRTELSFLRAQVNPHFMLNVLNSMVLLAR